MCVSVCVLFGLLTKKSKTQEVKKKIQPTCWTRITTQTQWLLLNYVHIFIEAIFVVVVVVACCQEVKHFVRCDKNNNHNKTKERTWARSRTHNDQVCKLCDDCNIYLTEQEKQNEKEKQFISWVCIVWNSRWIGHMDTNRESNQLIKVTANRF